MEREKGFEPSTSTLARWHSTTELLPRRRPVELASHRCSVNLVREIAPAPLLKARRPEDLRKALHRFVRDLHVRAAADVLRRVHRVEPGVLRVGRGHDEERPVV